MQLQYTRDFRQQLTNERVEVPAVIPDPPTPVKKRHSQEKKNGWTAKRAKEMKRTKSGKPTEL